MKQRMAALAPAFALSLLAATAAAPAAAQSSDQGSWLVRAHATYLDPRNKDNTGLDLSVNSKWIPEVDVSYFFTPNIAAELVLTVPQKHDLNAGGVGQIGTLKHLPPTLSLQYHFTGLQGFRPYVGIGVNYTHFSKVNFDPAVAAALGPSIDKDVFGVAFGAGVDVPIGGGWLLNFDVKKIQIRTDVSSFGSKVGEFKVDPLVVGFGFGKRF